MPGPLESLRVLELGGIGPVPFAGMVLADLGADVVTIDRPRARPPVDDYEFADRDVDPLARGRRSMLVDLKAPEASDVVLRLVGRADVVLDPFRPGVAERLGIGPDVCLARNPMLVYGRMTGWGQDGPLARHAGHDLNYLALAGALEGSGRTGAPPTFAQNLVADFGGGGMLLVVGVLAALHERSRSGIGQVVDAAMLDGAALLTAFAHGLRASGRWQGPRGANLLDSGSHHYEVYETADAKWVAVGAIEHPFYDRLLECLGLADDEDLRERRTVVERWPEYKERFAAVFRTRTRDEWAARFAEEADACVTPVLTLDEAPRHPHNAARAVFADVGGVVQPAPAPRFSRTPAPTPSPPRGLGADTDALLGEVGYSPDEVDALRASGAVG